MSLIGAIKGLFGSKPELNNKETIPESTAIDLNNSFKIGKNKLSLSLSKRNVKNVTAEVAMVLDVSGSMRYSICNGSVQRLINTIYPIADSFDDNGSMEFYVFSESSKLLGNLNSNNYSKYIKKHEHLFEYGGTYYANPLRAILNEAKNGNYKYPVFVIFITDGDNFDKHETDNVIRELSNYDVYIQMVGIGDVSFDYLERLDSLSGRKFDNVGFRKCVDIYNMHEEQLYDVLIDEFIDLCKSKNVFKKGIKLDLIKED